MNVLIIEDEVTASRGLIKMLNDVYPAVNVLAQLASIRESVQWLKSNEEPDLIFLDIQLKDGLSFEIFDQVSCFAPVIFCTAFDQYAINAFKLNSIDYLLKPYKKDELKQALGKFEKLRDERGTIDYKALSIAIRKGEPVYKERFLVRAGKKFYQVFSERIAYIHTQDKVNFITTRENKQYIIDEYLDELEKVLNPTSFFRVNRQFIVSIDAIASLENDYGKYYVHLLPAKDTAVAVSRSRVQEFKKWLGETSK